MYGCVLIEMIEDLKEKIFFINLYLLVWWSLGFLLNFDSLLWFWILKLMKLQNINVGLVISSYWLK